MSHRSNRPVDWETLVKDNQHRLYRAALAILGRPQEAEDAVQDTFVTYLEKAPTELENASAWLMRVLVNNCRSRLRRRGREPLPLMDWLPTPGPEAQEELEELRDAPEVTFEEEIPYVAEDREELLCSVCGKPADRGALFCSGCGAKLPNN